MSCYWELPLEREREVKMNLLGPGSKRGLGYDTHIRT